MYSHSEIRAIERGAQEELARREYQYFFELANPKLKLYPHIKYICQKMQKIMNGEQKFYIVEMPPQHGKSTTITETFASYFLMKNPDKHVMITTYSEYLYTQFAEANRKNFSKWAPRLFGLKMSKNTSKTFNILNHDGGFYATSMLGGASGMSADLLIIDDPNKNAEEASSATIRKKIWDEWTMTFYPRLQKGGSVIVIMTRWHTEDLAGQLLKNRALPWEEIKLPAIAENIPAGETDTIGRRNGDALCPELHPLKELETHKLDMGSHKFEAMYQQSPTIEGGNIFKRDWVKFYVPDRQKMTELGLTDKDVEIPERHFDEQVQAWDATFKSKENDDFVAGQTWARRGAKLYLLPHWCHKRLSFTQTLDAIRAMTQRYPHAAAKLVEDKANGPAIIDTLKKEIPGIVPVSPGADSKEARASSVSPIWEAGQIYVPHPLWMPEIDDWLEEIFGFPNMPHDDNVDSMVYAVRRLNKKSNGPFIRF